MWILGGITIFLLTFVSTLAISACNYTLRASADGSGLGLFATTDIEPFDILEVSIGIPIPIRAILWNKLIYYVEGLNGTHALLALGVGMMLNHAPKNHASVRKVMSFQDGIRKFREPYQSSIDFIHEFTSYVAPGEQLLVDYGDDWFDERKIPHINLAVEETTHHSDIPTVCAEDWTAVTFDNTVIAARDIPANTVIEISRALLLPVTEALLTSGPLEEMLWWHRDSERLRTSIDITRHPDSPYLVPELGETHRHYAMLLSGRGALYSPASSSICSSPNDTQTSLNSTSSVTGNVRFAWYSIPQEVHQSAESVEGAKVSCRDVMQVSVMTSVFIPAGDVIRIQGSCLDPSTGRRFLLDNTAITQCLTLLETDPSEVTEEIEEVSQVLLESPEL